MIEPKVLVIGGSAGSLHAMQQFIGQLNNKNYATVILIHIPDQGELMLIKTLNTLTDCNVLEATEKTPLTNGLFYVAAGGYHLYVESDYHFSISNDEKIHFCRPSIDVLFKSVAEVYKKMLRHFTLRRQSRWHGRHY